MRILDFTHKVFGDEVILLDCLLSEGASFFGSRLQLAVKIDNLVCLGSIDLFCTTETFLISSLFKEKNQTLHKLNIVMSVLIILLVNKFVKVGTKVRKIQDEYFSIYLHLLKKIVKQN